MIGETLRLLRVFNDYTMTEMSKKVGLSQSYISELENGKKQPSLEIIEKYATVFDMKPSTVLLFSETLEIDQVDNQDKKQRVARAGMRLLKILDKLGKLDEEE
ncbi:MAG: helix-turn-helix transcriptional regulator [Lachnospiraceae bacterium]|nr:helix-turn-helix transcriptional regulator [Lachnospiraceae bacterium]